MGVLVDGELILYGTVGDDLWGDGFTALDVVSALAEVGRGTDINVRLNSGGGYASEGAAIFNALAAHRGNVTMYIDSVAASAASVIAMAGDEIIMRKGAVMMIHDPSALTIGNADDHAKSKEMLDALGDSYADIYAEQTGQTPEESRADMKSELWMTADQAVEKGYADRVEAGDDVKPTAFDYRLYQHAPERFVAMASTTPPDKPRSRAKAARAAAKPREMEIVMTDKTLTADEAKILSDAAVALAVEEQRKTSLARSDAAEIAKLCADSGVPAMASSLLAEGVTLEVASQRIGAAGQMKEMVALARRTNKDIPEDQATTFLKEGKTLEQARAALFDKIVAKQEETKVNSHVSVETKPAATEGWNKAFAAIPKPAGFNASAGR